MNAIDTTSEQVRFTRHLENNPRTIFSAKFGDGKTYFLKEYINQHKDNTLFIVLHPINYSVATNEDIFEYIKQDILIELSKEVNFNEMDWKNVAKTIFDYDTILEECEQMAEVLPHFKTLLLPFRLFKKVDEKYVIDKYFSRFVEMKGSIFEQDQYTAAIKAAIEEIQEKGRKCILIIEDLDRIDPKHLFRILNVLGAHIDENVNSNKFGLDNIIAVLDYEKTEHIFQHFYGSEANYNGYMAKFISHNIFEYSVSHEAIKILKSYLKNECNLCDQDFQYTWHSDRRRGLPSIAEKLRKLSIRDVVNVLNEIDTQYFSEPVQIGNCKINPKEPIVKLLAILTRLNVRFETRRLIEFLHQSPEHYSMLGAFTLVEPQILRKMLEFSEGSIAIIPVNEDGINTVNFVPMMSGIVGEYQSRTESIINEVYKYVHDCKPL